MIDDASTKVEALADRREAISAKLKALKARRGPRHGR
jgi:hypothetical protein